MLGLHVFTFPIFSFRASKQALAAELEETQWQLKVCGKNNCGQTRNQVKSFYQKSELVYRITSSAIVCRYHMDKTNETGQLQCNWTSLHVRNLERKDHLDPGQENSWSNSRFAMILNHFVFSLVFSITPHTLLYGIFLSFHIHFFILTIADILLECNTKNGYVSVLSESNSLFYFAFKFSFTGKPEPHQSATRKRKVYKIKFLFNAKPLEIKSLGRSWLVGNVQKQAAWFMQNSCFGASLFSGCLVSPRRKTK